MHCHVWLQAPLCWKVFQSAWSRVIARECKKALYMCACVLFCFCFSISDLKCTNCNAVCPVFLRTSMRWRFSLLIGLDWGAKLQLLSYEISGQGLSQLLSRADSTVGFFLMTLLCIRFIPFAKWQFFNFLTLWLQKIYKIVWLVKDENIGW